MHKAIEQYLDRLGTTGDGKVYCRDCRYLVPARQRQTGVFFYRRRPFIRALGESLCCLHPNARRIEVLWWGKQETQVHPSTRNAHNDCPDFQPMTWWQRWGPGVVLVSGVLVAGYLLCWGAPLQ
jgi:hypothetical protein